MKKYKESVSRITLSQKLFSYYFAIIFAIIIILSSYAYFTAKNALITRTYEQLTSVQFEKQGNVVRYFNERLDEASEILKISNWKQIMEKSDKGLFSQNDFLKVIKSEYSDKLERYFIGNSYYSQILFVCRNRANIAIDIGKDDNSSIYSLPRQFETPITDIIGKIIKRNKPQVVESATGDLYIGSYINPCHCQDKTAVVLLKMDMEEINKIMFNTNKMNGLGETGEAYIIGDDYLMRTTSRFKGFSEKKNFVRTVGAETALKNVSGTGQYMDYRGNKVLGAYGKLNIPGLNWAILAEIDLKEAMVPIFTLRNSIIILSLIVSLILFGVVLIITKHITQPVLKLKQATDNISLGNYEIHIDNNSKDEIGELSDAFNRMIDKIKEQNKELYEERSKRITSVFDGQEQERQRLARELHDGLGQRILAVKMQLERAENASQEMKQKLIDDAKVMLSSVSKEVVEMSENLMPHVLTEFGLVSAIENLCEEIKTVNDIEISFIYDTLPESCPSKVKIYLYRIIQEALNNIVKHADAKNAVVTLSFEDNLIHLGIKDDGKGFDNSNLRKGANGIMNMRDRVEILGGTFEIRSRQKGGTKIEITITIDIKE